MHFRWLSIPFAWDFSMHRFFVFCGWWGGGVFQFPLLGIFPCIAFLFFVVGGVVVSFNSLCLGFFHASSFMPLRQYWFIHLSIPFAWDFSMHHLRTTISKHL